MPVKITELPQATIPLAGTEVVEIVQDGLSKQVDQTDLVGSVSPLNSEYVVVSADATLPNERILAGEGSVVSITDGGAGANITVGLVTGGIANVKLADMAQATVKGRASGAGTGVPTDLTAAQLATILGTTGFGYLTLTATARVIGSDCGSANIADNVIIMGAAAADLMADTDFDGSIVLGVNAWSRAVGAATTLGSMVVIGANAHLNNTSALSGSSVIIGTSALESSNVDNPNATTQTVVIGPEAAQRQADNPASNAVVIGYRAGRCAVVANATINGAVYIGALAGQGQNSAGNCTAVGNGAMSLATLTGSENSCFGRLSGSNLAGGANNTCLGASAGTGLSSESDNVMVGQSIVIGCAESVLIGNQTSTRSGASNGISIGHLAGRNLPAGDGQFVVEAVQSSGLNRLSFLYGEMDEGNLVLGEANSGGGLPPVNRDFGGGTPNNVYKIHDTASAPSSAATAGVTMWSASGQLNIFGGVVNRGETFYLGIVSPAALGAGVTNNWAPTLTGATRVELSGGAAAEITGLAGGTDGRYLILTNIGATNAVIIRDEDALSTAANRFSMNGDLILGLSESATFLYSITLSRWTRVNNA